METKLIPLTQGLFTTVDAADYDTLSKYKWYAQRKPGGKVYAKRANWGCQPSAISMHRVIAGKPGFDVDHRDGNGLNNTRANLRVATRAQNRWNQGRQRNNSSGYKGVRYSNADKTFQAQIRVNGTRKHLGSFRTAQEAHAAYSKAALELHGEFARLS